MRYKTVFRGKEGLKGSNNGIPIKGIYIELDKTNFARDFHKVIERYRRSKSGFQDRRRIRFWAYLELTKSNLVRGILTTACECQKFFLEVVMQEYISSMKFIDTVPEGSSLSTLCQIILNIKSKQFPNISLIHSIDRT